ncbi:hypothetical protein EVAR_21801_1 [Eumeta japonica]|uniref:Uncharacterized protein n=1 Tax=Eumeta variegata TaxID=151549 RepID=A0A4C1YKT5_EUMVA|nr:hypothetical protein EVAR_21801_1 [Eumeta japonica]
MLYQTRPSLAPVCRAFYGRIRLVARLYDKSKKSTRKPRSKLCSAAASKRAANLKARQLPAKSTLEAGAGCSRDARSHPLINFVRSTSSGSELPARGTTSARRGFDRSAHTTLKLEPFCPACYLTFI